MKPTKRPSAVAVLAEIERILSRIDPADLTKAETKILELVTKR